MKIKNSIYQLFKCVILVVLNFNVLIAQETENIDFALLRQNDDISYFKIKKNKSFYDNLKYAKISQRAYLSLGGSYRGQYEFFDNEGFEQNSEGWWLNRLMLHSDFQWNNFRLYAEVNSSSVWSKEFPSPVDRDELAISQLFVSYELDRWKILIGRESPNYGTHRILALREGPNIRRYFDSAKLTYSDNVLRSEGFLAFPVEIFPFSFDNKTIRDREYLWGSYNTVSIKKDKFLADFYYIGRVIDDLQYVQGVADEERHSFGARMFGEAGEFYYDFETLYQLGSFGTSNIGAYTFSLHVAYGFGNEEVEYEFGLKTELISGDDNSQDDELNTFNALYPRGAYFGRVAQFGPANLIDIHPEFSIAYKNFILELDYVAFWRESVSDGVYGAAGTLDFPTINDEKFIGHQYGVVFNWSPSPFVSLEAESNLIMPGGFLEQSELNNTLFHFVFTTEFKF